MAMLNPTQHPIRVRIVKGCRAFGARSAPTVFSGYMEAVSGMGNRVRFAGMTLWLAGNRVRVPAIEKGQRFNAHKGDPTAYITIEMM